MLGLGPHAGFIIASYAVTALVLAGLIAWAYFRERNLQRLLAELERQGLSRRPLPQSETR